MAWTLDEVTAALGDEAQITAGGIVVLETYVDPVDNFEKRRHVKVGTFEGMSFVLTPEGEEIMSRFDAPEEAPKAKKGKKEVAPAGDQPPQG